MEDITVVLDTAEPDASLLGHSSGAIFLLEHSAPTDMDAGQIDRLREALEAPYDHRTQRAVREAVTSDRRPPERITRLIDVVDELGLQPPEPLEPFPEIVDEDIHLVCWMALVPRD